MRRFVGVSATLLLIAGASSAHADWGSGTGGGGAYVGKSEQETKALPKEGPWQGSGTGNDGKPIPKTVPYQYATFLACGHNGPTEGREVGCSTAMTTCSDVPNATGPYVVIYRRTVAPDNSYGPWENLGTTCYPNLVPGGGGKPQLTLAMIKEVWSHTPFAKPALTMQPKGNQTLVTLPGYFTLEWPGAGYQPGEVRTVTLLGHQVRIKPTLVTNTYSFGDGASSGPTSSLGGPYPTGDIRHAYTTAGSYTSHVTSTYGGQFSVDGGSWTDITGTLPIAGPGQTITVRTAKNRLVNQ